jgi:hypothetical protein
MRSSTNDERPQTASTKLRGSQDDLHKNTEARPALPPLKDPAQQQERIPVPTHAMSSKAPEQTASFSFPRMDNSSASLIAVLTQPKEKAKRVKGMPKTAQSSRTPNAASPPVGNGPPSSSHGRHKGTPSSPANEYAPGLPQQYGRPGGPRRTSSQDGNFLIKGVKKGKDTVQAGGMKAVGFLDKVGHVAWDKLKSPVRLPKHAYGRSISPQCKKDLDQYRDTSKDIEVFGMSIKEAVLKTRIVNDRKMPGDATFWMPAIAYRSLQYVVAGGVNLGAKLILAGTLTFMVRQKLVFTEYQVVHLSLTSSAQRLKFTTTSIFSKTRPTMSIQSLLF